MKSTRADFDTVEKTFTYQVTVNECSPSFGSPPDTEDTYYYGTEGTDQSFCWFSMNAAQCSEITRTQELTS